MRGYLPDKTGSREYNLKEVFLLKYGSADQRFVKKHPSHRQHDQ